LVTSKLEKLADLDLDAIYVLTPIPSHYSVIKEIYSKDVTRSVFVEKTLAANYVQSKELSELSQKNRGINMVGYMKRFGVTFNQAKKFLEQGAIGNVTSFNAFAFSSDFADAPSGTLISKARGGALEDLGSHIADIAIWFFGDLDVVYAKIDSRIATDSEDSIIFKVTNSKGLNGNFEVSWCRSDYRMPEFGLTVQGTKGTLTVNDDEVKLEIAGTQPRRWYRHDLDDNVGFFLGGTEYYRENAHFIKCLISGAETISDFKSALRVDHVLDSVRREATNA
jgi:predicted dehydrogenase